jgi:hypothetical protein
MAAEIVWLGHDNSVNRVLKSEGIAVALTSVTRMTLSFGSVLVDSDNGDADPIRWIKSDYAVGEIRMFLGGQTIAAGSYQSPLVVYDATNVNGVVWGMIPIMVMADPEAPPPP